SGRAVLPAGSPDRSWACGDGGAPLPRGRWPATGSGRAPASVFARPASPRPTGRPERRRGAARRRQTGRLPSVRRRSRQIPAKARAGNRAFQAKARSVNQTRALVYWLDAFSWREPRSISHKNALASQESEKIAAERV